MSKQVDVLGLLDAAIVGVVNDPIRERRGHRENLIEARAAVAELIAANVAFSAAWGDMMKSPNDKNGNSTVALWHVANDRRSAALARCKGGAA